MDFYSLDESNVFNLSYLLEINAYLTGFEDFQGMAFDQRAVACLLIYNRYTEEAVDRDLYLVSDYIVGKRKEVENILNDVLEEKGGK